MSTFEFISVQLSIAVGFILLRFHRVLARGRILSLPFLLITVSCGMSEKAGEVPGQGTAVQEHEIADGESVTIQSPNDSMVGGGVAISVRNRDGTKVRGVFRGPAKLAETVSGGTFEFHEDSLLARVRLLGPGEELRRRDSIR